MKGFHLRLRSLKYKEHLHKTQSTKQSFISFTQLIDTFMIQATWTVNSTLHFKHQHLGTFQSSLPYEKFLHREKLNILKLTLLHIQKYAHYTKCLTYT